MWLKILNAVLDILMFVVPIMELSEFATLMPPEFLPWYMLATVVLRRVVRVLEQELRGKKDDA